MKLGKREKILTVVFGAFITLFLLEKGLFLPFSSRLDIIASSIEASETKIKRLFYIDSQKENIQKKFEEVKPYIEIGETTEDALSLIMGKIEGMVKSYGITLLNMKPESGASRSEFGYNTKKVSLNIEGTQTNIVKFLYQLDNNQYPLSIRKLDLKVKNRKAGLLEASLDVIFIYFL